MSRGRTPRLPQLRLLVERGRLVEARPLVLLGGLAARSGLVRAYALWPRADEPLIAVDLRSRPAAAWLRTTFERDARAPALVSAATWNAVRARALVLGQPRRMTIRAAESGLGRALSSPRLCTFSPTGMTLSKITCFVFERDDAAPKVVVKAMPERRHAERLRHETEFVEALRSRLSRERALVLPLRPLWAGDLDGDYLVVQAVDPLAGATGHGTRPAALRWLRGFQAETTEGFEPWSAADTRVAREHVRHAWGRVRQQSEPAVSARVAALLGALHGQAVRRCAIHGDFWRGNVAESYEGLRVYDWEWSKLACNPFVDLWTYELAELRQRAERERLDLSRALEAALERVRTELRAQEVDARFALASAAPVLAWLAFRVRNATGVPGGGEDASARLMAALEPFILRPDARLDGPLRVPSRRPPASAPPSSRP